MVAELQMISCFRISTDMFSGILPDDIVYLLYGYPVLLSLSSSWTCLGLV